MELNKKLYNIYQRKHNILHINPNFNISIFLENKVKWIMQELRRLRTSINIYISSGNIMFVFKSRLAGILGKIKLFKYEAGY